MENFYVIARFRSMANLLFICFTLNFLKPVYGQESSWNINYTEDEFSGDAVLDLTYLNENIAGENGFITLSEDGESFVNGNGEEMRFWAIGGGGLAREEVFRPLSDEQLEYFAKFLAKKGVNMIRFHGAIHSVTDDINQVNIAEVEAIWKMVAVMKEHGIYSTISPYWAGHVSTIPIAWGLGDYFGETKPWGLMYFEDKLKNAYKRWVEYLFTEINPHTGIALKDDPAVALIQIKNEDGLFWYTQQDFKPSLVQLVEERFYDWLIGKYGTIENAYANWGNTLLPEDNIAGGRMAQYIIWEATQEQTGGKQKRLTDQIEFYVDVQRNFYGEIYDHFRNMGCQQLINANNWKTSSPTRLFDAERLTYEICDVIAVNRYYSPNHIGENSGWRIEPGHKYVGSSVLFNPHKFPINAKQVMGKPFIMSESGWNLPHKYQAEGPFLIAAYMSLTGFDAYYWFSPSSYTNDALPYWDFANVNGQMPMFRWTVSIPGQIGMFPANALMYRKGFVTKGDLVVHEERTLESIYQREVPLISEDNSFDPNRDSYGNAQSEGETDLPPITHLTGQVRVKYGGNPTNTNVSNNLDELLDLTNKKIHSTTGELVWDYKNGYCTLDAPSAKGFCGFPGNQQSFELSGVTIKTTNEYVVVNVVSMDDTPIQQAEKILIQVGTVYRPTNWTESQASFNLGDETVNGFQINNVGKMPWTGIDSKVSVVIDNPAIQSARLIDMNGYEAREIFVKVHEDNNTREIMVPTNGMYIIADTRPASVLGLEENFQGQINFYPNPSSGLLQVDIPQEALHFTSIEVQSIEGKVMQSFNAGSSTYQLNLNDGIYLVHLKKGEEHLFTKKIIIMK